MVSHDTLIRDPEGGVNQSGLRDQNARLVLSYIRRHGALASAEIARRSGLSAQTVSNIIRALEAEGLLTRGEAVKGKVGKPSVPVALNPEGVLSLGLNIGRRSAELVLVDFNGRSITAHKTAFPYPEIGAVFRFLAEGLDRIFEARPGARRKITGIGVARPNELWNWLGIVNAPAAAMQAWKDLDLKADIEAAAGFEAFIGNDMTSACVAEQLLGRGSEFSDFSYIFVGSFVGGGLVLGNKVVWGATGNTGALGPLPVPDGAGGMTQLLNVASLHVLERAMAAEGLDPLRLRAADDWSAFEAYLAPWVELTAGNLAVAAVAIASVVEVEAILIDGAMPGNVRARLVERTGARMEALDLTGLPRPQIGEAAVGRNARSVGAALLPIHSRYFLA